MSHPGPGRAHAALPGNTGRRQVPKTYREQVRSTVCGLGGGLCYDKIRLGEFRVESYCFVVVHKSHILTFQQYVTSKIAFNSFCYLTRISRLKGEQNIFNV